jgi:hypothetical protein
MAHVIGEHDKPDSVSLGGSVFVNNTSYAGCDIKVVVNLYDGGKATQHKIDELQDKMTKAQSELELAETKAAEATSNLETAKRGTSGFSNNTKKRSKYTTSATRLQDVVQSLGQRLADLAQEKPQVSTKVLAECQTLSLSVYRDKQAVRACGSVYPKAFTRGPRQIAGTLVFTVFNQHVLHELLDAHVTDFDGVSYSSVLADQLPPVDIIVVFANEYGATSRMAVLGVEFSTEGQTMSVEDMITENVISFVARDLDPMRSVGQQVIDQASSMLQNEMGKRASDLLLEEDYQRYKNNISPFDRFRRRRNPFI